ncbi:MAG: hypothetical protein K2G24_04515 [Muribaculaceae bacterium]|nr:hypothetical protein [Muribaculaceae bacterium]
MKSLLFLAAAAAIATAISGCGNQNTQQETVEQDEQVMQKLGDEGPAAIAEPASEGVTAAGDTVVTIVDDVNIR